MSRVHITATDGIGSMVSCRHAKKQSAPINKRIFGGAKEITLAGGGDPASVIYMRPTVGRRITVGQIAGTLGGG